LTSSAYPYPLPSGWTWCSLDDVATSMTDGPFGSNLKSSDYIPSGVRVIRLGNIGVGAFKDDDRSFISEEKFASLTKHEARAGDLVIAALADPVGRACIVPDTVGQALVKADCVRARITPEVGAMLVMRWMNSPEGLRSAALASHGIGRLRINLGEMRALPVPLPPAPEQRRIVAKLDEVFAQTRAAKARLERLPALIDKLKRSILAAAFRGDLTADWRAANPDVEPASALINRLEADRRSRWESGVRAKGKSPAHAAYEPAEAADAAGLPLLPPSWGWSSLDAVRAYDAPLCYGVVQPGVEPPSGGVPLIRVCDLADGTVSLDTLRTIAVEVDAEYSRSRVRGGEVLVSVVGTIGRVAVVPRLPQPANIARAVAKLAPADPIDPQWLRLWISSTFMESRLGFGAREVARATLNIEVLRGQPLPLAPLTEMAEICRRVDVAFGAIVRAAARVARATSRATKLEQLALAKAFRGELVPQDPADEPAEVLLARLRAAKAEEAPVARRSRAAAPEPTYAAPPITLAQAAESGPLFQHALERRERAAPEPAAQDLVVAALQQSDGRLTAAAIAQTTGLAPAAVRAALKDLIAAGQVHTHGKARGTTYTWAG
jgi:type I restriction enzyme S subunit